MEDCNCHHAFKLFPCKSHCKGGPPATGRLLEHCRILMPRKSGKGDALRKEKALLAYFCCRTKVWRRAGRNPPVLILSYKSRSKIIRTTDEPPSALFIMNSGRTLSAAWAPGIRRLYCLVCRIPRWSLHTRRPENNTKISSQAV